MWNVKRFRPRHAGEHRNSPLKLAQRDECRSALEIHEPVSRAGSGGVHGRIHDVHAFEREQQCGQAGNARTAVSTSPNSRELP